MAHTFFTRVRMRLKKGRKVLFTGIFLVILGILSMLLEWHLLFHLSNISIIVFNALFFGGIIVAVIVFYTIIQGLYRIGVVYTPVNPK